MCTQFDIGVNWCSHGEMKGVEYVQFITLYSCKQFIIGVDWGTQVEIEYSMYTILQYTIINSLNTV